MCCVQFAGPNPAPQLIGEQHLAGSSNDFASSNPASWPVDVPQYAQVAYHNLYPGIDAVYYGNGQQQLEYDLVVAPGADPSAARLSIQGAQALKLDSQGNLLIQTAGGQVVEQAPTLYQVQGSSRQAVSGSYVLNANGTVGFQVGAYDPSRPLTIDPVLNYSTYLGGSGTDSGYGVAVDAAGNAYLVGTTASTNFPTTTGPAYGGGTDIFVGKLSPSGQSLVYSTYLGGGSNDQSYAVAVDSAGNAYLTGSTSSPNYPTTASAYQTSFSGYSSAFLAKLNITGDALLYSSVLNGSNSSANVSGTALAVDATGASVGLEGGQVPGQCGG
jgi:hypothetical protein